MSFEQFSLQNKAKHSIETDRLASGFSELIHGYTESKIFEALEEDLEQENFNLADEGFLSEIFHNGALLCRSESFSRVLDLILEGSPIDIKNEDGRPNMCSMASGKGFKVAMNEGFSGKDVEGVVKVVITFRGESLDSREKVTRNSDLWETKPETAKVSLVGNGEIHLSEIEMVSFRFPTRFYPEHLLSEDEQERLVDGGIQFIVRHYIPKKEKTIH